MRIRTAVSILTLSASLMLGGLAIGVEAQDDDSSQMQRRRRPRLRPGRARRRPPAARRAKQQQQQQQQAEGSEGGDIEEFRTGVDYRPVSPRTRVTFNLEDADLPDLVRLISNMTGKRFILPGKVRSIKATVFAPTEVTAAEAYNAFLSILEVNGLNVVPAGRYLKIVETTGIQNQPIPTLTGGGGAPGDDRFVTQLIRLDNVSASDVSSLLDRFKSQAGSITAYAPTNSLIITDTGRQIRRMMQIIRAIDIARTGEQVWIEPIHYAEASELAQKLQEIFPPSDGSSSGGSASPAPAKNRSAAARRARARRRRQQQNDDSEGDTESVGSSGGESRVNKIIPDERTNSLIIIATERAYLRILEMIRQLDIPLEGEGRIHVHYVQHADAADIASTLTTLIGGGSGGGGGGGGGGNRRGNQQAAAAGAAPDLFEGAIRVTSYEPSNALVITSSLHDYAALRRVIERLDARRRQVFIEAVIMELGVSRSSQLGLSFHGGLGNFPTDGSLSILGFNAQGSLSPVSQDSLTGLAVGVRGPTIEDSQQLVGLSIPGFGVVINALATTGDANVLSTPHIIAMDNVQAEITVGENIPLQTSGIPPGALGGLGSLAGLAGAAGQNQQGGLAGLAGLAAGGLGAVPRQDVGTTIRLTPHINEADEIRLEIEEEISERGATEGDLGVVSINRRVAKTEVMVRDQQTVVIGGLMRESTNTSETKVPILGDIPLIGALFRRTSRQSRKTNLLLFLTPYIIRDPSDLRSIFERKMRERQEFLDRYFVFGDHDYEPPVDYSRTRGLLAEIIAEVEAIEEEARLMEEAAAAPPPEHVPRAPVGAYERPSGGEEGDMYIEPGDEEFEGAEGEEPADAEPADAEPADEDLPDDAPVDDAPVDDEPIEDE